MTVSIRHDVRSDRRRGFTLVEVLVVVALIALIGGTGVGMYATSYKRMLLEKAARELMLAAKYGRVLAVEQQMPFTVEYDAESHAFALTTVHWNEETGESTKVIIDDYYCKLIQLPEHVMVEQFMIANNSVDISSSQADDEENAAGFTFQPNGTADAAIVQLGNGYSHYTVSVAPYSGKATVIYGTAEQTESKVVDLEEEEQ